MSADEMVFALIVAGFLWILASELTSFTERLADGGRRDEEEEER